MVASHEHPMKSTCKAASLGLSLPPLGCNQPGNLSFLHNFRKHIRRRMGHAAEVTSGSFTRTVR